MSVGPPFRNQLCCIYLDTAACLLAIFRHLLSVSHFKFSKEMADWQLSD